MGKRESEEDFPYRRFFDGERVKVLFMTETVSKGIAGCRGKVMNYTKIGPSTFVAVALDDEDIWWIRECVLENGVKE